MYSPVRLCLVLPPSTSSFVPSSYSSSFPVLGLPLAPCRLISLFSPSSLPSFLHSFVPLPLSFFPACSLALALPLSPPLPNSFPRSPPRMSLFNSLASVIPQSMHLPSYLLSYESGVTPLSTVKEVTIAMLTYFLVIFSGREIMRSVPFGQ